MKSVAKKPQKEKKKQKQKDVIKLGSEMDPKQVSMVVDALLKVAKAKSKDLFESERICLQVTAVKLPQDGPGQLVKIVLPHCPLPDPFEACLLVRDEVKGIREDHEPTAVKYASLLKERNVGKDVISEVMPLRQLKVEYKTFESKTALCNRFDRILADDRIVRLLPKFLGKAFYRRKKFPIPANLRAKDLRSEIDKALRTVMLPLGHRGTCAMVEVGNALMGKVELVENITKACQVLRDRYPGGWKNLRSVHIKAETSMAIPIHSSTVSPNDIGPVNVLPSRVPRGPVTDELSTIPGATVTVHPDGTVEVFKTKDPDMDESDEEEDEELDDEGSGLDADEEVPKKKARLTAAKRVKKDQEDESDGSQDESSEDEDAELEEAEKNYINRMAASVPDGQEKKEESEEEGSAYDDDDELDDENIVRDDDPSDEDEESEDEDSKLLLKKSQVGSDSE